MMRLVAIADIAQVNPRLPRGLAQEPEKMVSFVPMVGVSEDGVLSDCPTRKLGEVSRGFTYFERGDILFAKITPCMENGKAAHLINLPCDIGFGSTEFHVLRPGPEVDGRYLFYMIWNPAFRYDAKQKMTGAAGQQRVPTDFIKEYKIPLPPLPEQRRIAAILDKADAVRRKRQETIRLTEGLLRSVFLDMFGDPVRNPKGLVVKPLGDVCDFTAGNSLPEGEPYNGQPAGHLLLKVGDMNLPGNETFISVGREWTGTFRGSNVAPIGSVVLPKRGGAISTNKKRMLTRPALLDPNLMGIFSPDLSINDYYLFQWFQGFDLNEISSGSAVPQLNKKDLSPLKIAVPPLGQQAKFEEIFRGVFALKDKYNNENYTDLFETIVQRAFRGDL